MITAIEVILLTWVFLFAVASLYIRDLLGAVLSFGAYSFLMCLVWTGMGAVDVAFTEAAVGAGVSSVFFLAMLYNTSRKSTPFSKSTLLNIWGGLAAILMGVVLINSMSDFPSWGDPESPVNANVSSYYITHTLADTAVPNIVTAVLGDYRGFDTMFETVVVFLALVVVMAILRPAKDEKTEVPARKKRHDGVILRVAARILVPFMQLFALYVVCHGHYSPGGGFQGGVILGASLILLSLSYDLAVMPKFLTEKAMMILAALGALIFAGIGLVPVIIGGQFLNYSLWSEIIPGLDSVMARYHAILGVEIGVALTVMCGMYGIYAYLVSDGRLERGL